MKSVVLAVVAVFASWLPMTVPAPAPGPDALIVIAGDQHSAYERTAQVVAAVDRLKAQHPGLPIAVLLDGDIFENGNAVARRSGGAVDFAMVTALARRAPTVVNLGNHETEFFGLAETVTRLEATGARVVTNIGDRETGKAAAPASTRIALGKREAVVVGVATDDLSTYRAAVRPSLTLANPLGWARTNFPTLLNVAPVSIVLSHAGFAADHLMLPIAPDGTLFAGAHDHLRFVARFKRTVYVHSGSWNTFLTLAWLRHDDAGRVNWDVEQMPVSTGDPGDPELVARIRETEAKYLEPEDRAVVAHLTSALAPQDAARTVVGALRRAIGVDATFIGNTTFGGGLPAGDVTRAAFDDCVRFDGRIFTTTVDGERLRRLLAAANQDANTPFAQRQGEFNVADGPASIDDAKTYRIATTDWGAKNSARYFGEPAIEWREQSGPTLKAIVLPTLGRQI